MLLANLAFAAPMFQDRFASLLGTPELQDVLNVHVNPELENTLVVAFALVLGIGHVVFLLWLWLQYEINRAWCKDDGELVDADDADGPRVSNLNNAARRQPKSARRSMSKGVRSIGTTINGMGSSLMPAMGKVRQQMGKVRKPGSLGSAPPVKSATSAGSSCTAATAAAESCSSATRMPYDAVINTTQVVGAAAECGVTACVTPGARSLRDPLAHVVDKG